MTPGLTLHAWLAFPHASWDSRTPSATYDICVRLRSKRPEPREAGASGARRRPEASIEWSSSDAGERYLCAPGPDDLGEPWPASRKSQGEQRGCGYLLLHDASTDRSQSEMTSNLPPAWLRLQFALFSPGLTRSELTVGLSTILCGGDASRAGE